VIRGRAVPLLLSIGIAVAGMGFPAPARANPSKQQCVDDNAAAQELRRQGHFDAASERLERCAVQSCPAIVRDDCTRLLNDLKAAQPSVVFEVRSPAGVDVVAVRVSVDGRLLTDHMNGTPLKIDPGLHSFTFEAPGKSAMTKTFLVREGELLRHERVVLGGLVAPEAPGAPENPGQGGGPYQTIGMSAAAVGLLGVALGAGFGLKARSSWDQAKSACGGDPSHCLDAPRANALRSDAMSAGAISTTAFVTGGALIAGGAFLYLMRGEHKEAEAKEIAVGAAVDPGKVGVVVRGVF
jgi:hypothetical protein